MRLRAESTGSKRIALRSPCFAQALGDHPWSPVRRMRRTRLTGSLGEQELCRVTLKNGGYRSISLLRAGNSA
jgi:hypothetical protein